MKDSLTPAVDQAPLPAGAWSRPYLGISHLTFMPGVPEEGRHFVTVDEIVEGCVVWGWKGATRHGQRPQFSSLTAAQAAAERELRARGHTFRQARQ